ncbi:Putative vesicle-associated membrane protein family protein, partial [Zea mays]
MKLPASNNKFTYNCDGHTFNYLVEDGFRCIRYVLIFGHLCVDLLELAVTRYTALLCFAAYCIVAVESVGQQIPIAFMDRVKEDFTKRLKLKEHMQYCVDHPEEVSKLAKVKAQVLDRGEKIEVLVDKTENLRSQ